KHRDPWAGPRQEIAAMEPATRAALAEDWERYQQLEQAERQRLRELHDGIEQDGDPASLRAALTDYEKWKSSLTPLQSAALVGAAPQERLDRMEKLRAEQALAISRTLSPADVKTIISWLETQVDQHQDRLVSALPQQARQRLESM